MCRPYTVGGMRRILLAVALLLLVREVGTRTSAAGAVLGIGLMAAAVNPAGDIGWVRAGILYGFVVVAFEAGSYYVWHAPFHFGPVFFGLAFSLLLIATYPQRKKLVPSTSSRDRPASLPAVEPAAIEAKKEEEAAKS